jgi:hypothetical protein
MIQNSGLNRVIGLLNNDLTHIGLGTGTAPSKSSSHLTNEIYRKQVTDPFIDGFILVKEVYLDETEANGSITEIGVFCKGADLSLNSGELFASFGSDITKTNTQSLTVSIEVEVSEVIK